MIMNPTPEFNKCYKITFNKCSTIENNVGK